MEISGNAPTYAQIMDSVRAQCHPFLRLTLQEVEADIACRHDKPLSGILGQSRVQDKADHHRFGEPHPH